VQWLVVLRLAEMEMHMEGEGAKLGICVWSILLAGRNHRDRRGREVWDVQQASSSR